MPEATSKKILTRPNIIAIVILIVLYVIAVVGLYYGGCLSL